MSHDILMIALNLTDDDENYEDRGSCSLLEWSAACKVLDSCPAGLQRAACTLHEQFRGLAGITKNMQNTRDSGEGNSFHEPPLRKFQQTRRGCVTSPHLHDVFSFFTPLRHTCEEGKSTQVLP